MDPTFGEQSFNRMMQVYEGKSRMDDARYILDREFKYWWATYDHKDHVSSNSILGDAQLIMNYIALAETGILLGERYSYDLIEELNSRQCCKTRVMNIITQATTTYCMAMDEMINVVIIFSGFSKEKMEFWAEGVIFFEEKYGAWKNWVSSILPTDLDAEMKAQKIIEVLEDPKLFRISLQSIKSFKLNQEMSRLPMNDHIVPDPQKKSIN